MTENQPSEIFVATKVIEVPRSTGFIGLRELALGHLSSNVLDFSPLMVGFKQKFIDAFTRLTGRQVFIISDFARVEGAKEFTMAEEDTLINVSQKDSDEVVHYEVPTGSFILTNDNFSTLGKLLSLKNFKH